MAQELTRIAIINKDRCKPKKCNQECKKSCPVNSCGKLCVQVEKDSVNCVISEPLCIGCGICVQKCPFEAISIINLPSNLNKDTTHRFGPNSFKLHRLPMPRIGQVLGLVGTNGIGKSTALNILSGKLKPNLGKYDNPPEWKEIIENFRGSSLQNYFTDLFEKNLKAIIKPQYIEQIPKVVIGTVRENLDKYQESDDICEKVIRELDLNEILNNDVNNLSGGELQRFACAIACVRNSNIIMFDEPSSYLDVKQRIKVAQAIRNLISQNTYLIVVEHDLSILDYLSDFVCCLYGSPCNYGVVTFPSSVANGINHFMDGFIPSENLRFRETSLSFNIAEKEKEEIKSFRNYEYPSMTKTQAKFTLDVEAGSFTDSEIIVLLGENGTGKSTFIRLLSGNFQGKIPILNVSYKPQILSPKFDGTVNQLIMTKIRNAVIHPQFKSDVFKPLDIQNILHREVKTLSGGELQRVALTLCLGKPADIYLIDEPSAYLDAEQRINAARVIKRYIRNSKKMAFIVEHDFTMATYLADRVVVFDGQPSSNTKANAPQSLLTGINDFLKKLNVTFRRDRDNFRPRINKLNGAKDIEQKNNNNFFFLD